MAISTVRWPMKGGKFGSRPYAEMDLGPDSPTHWAARHWMLAVMMAASAQVFALCGREMYAVTAEPAMPGEPDSEHGEIVDISGGADRESKQDLYFSFRVACSLTQLVFPGASNPPYPNPLADEAAAKLLAEYEAPIETLALALLHNPRMTGAKVLEALGLEPSTSAPAPTVAPQHATGRASPVRHAGPPETAP